MRAHACTLTHTHTLTHTQHQHTCARTRLHTHIHNSHTCACTLTHTHAYTHTHTHTLTHTHTHNKDKGPHSANRWRCDGGIRVLPDASPDCPHLSASACWWTGRGSWSSPACPHHGCLLSPCARGRKKKKSTLLACINYCKVPIDDAFSLMLCSDTYTSSRHVRATQSDFHEKEWDVDPITAA